MNMIILQSFEVMGTAVYCLVWPFTRW